MISSTLFAEAATISSTWAATFQNFKLLDQAMRSAGYTPVDKGREVFIDGNPYKIFVLSIDTNYVVPVPLQPGQSAVQTVPDVNVSLP